LQIAIIKYVLYILNELKSQHFQTELEALVVKIPEMNIRKLDKNAR